MRKLLVYGLFAMLGLWGSVTASGAPPADGPVIAEVSLTQQSLRVGDQVGLRVRVTHPADIQIAFPQLTDKLGALEVLSSKPLPDARFLDGTQISVMEYTVTGFFPGSYAIPPITVTYTTSAGQREAIATSQALGVEIMSLLEAQPNLQFQDIKPPLEIPQAPIAYVPTIAPYVLVIGVLVLALLLARRWPRKRFVLGLPRVAVTPDAAAREELTRIVGLGLLEQEAYTTYYSLISSCIRRYLDERYGIYAVGSTTQELRRSMDERGMDRWHARIVSGLLEECDAAKWAHYEPLSARGDRAMTIAFEIVSLTLPPEEPVNALAPQAVGRG